MADTFLYQCSRCGESLTLPVSLLGQHGECPSCQNIEVLQDASADNSPRPPSAPPLHPASPFSGAPVVAESVLPTTNPYATPTPPSFQFGSVNPDHRGLLGKTLWATIITFTLAIVWALFVIIESVFAVLATNPERFEGLSEAEIEIEFIIALAEQTSDFDRQQVANATADEIIETAGLAILQGLASKLLGSAVLYLIGIICYLTFFHTLWSQIQDDPTVRFSPAAIVLLHFIPTTLVAIGILLATTNAEFLLALNFLSVVAWWVIMFISYWKLADYMEKYCQRQNITGTKISPGLALAFCLMQVATIIPVLGGLISLACIIAWFLVVFNLKHCAVEIINHKMRTEQADRAQ